MLKYLTLEVRAGLGNRIRVIASGKRLCERIGAELSVIWKWGDYHRLFEIDPFIKPIIEIPAKDEMATVNIVHNKATGNYIARRIPLNLHERIVLSTVCVITGDDEDEELDEKDVADWLPKPSPEIQKKVDDFKAQHLTNAVGMHLRRGDKINTITLTAPDKEYIREAQRIIDAGRNIFVCSDCESPIQMMQEKFKDKIITYPKLHPIPQRWPRKFNLYDLIDDYMEMSLLAACHHVIGAKESSFSKVAAAYNGSDECHMIDIKKGY